MPRARNTLLALVVCTLAPAAAAGQDAGAEVAEAYEAWDAAFNAGDAEGLAALYAEDALFLPPTHTVLTGPAEIEEFFAGLFEAGVSGHRLEVIEAGGEAPLYAAANWSAEAKGEDGAPQEIGGIATHVFTRSDDGNLTLALHTSN